MNKATFRPAVKGSFIGQSTVTPAYGASFWMITAMPVKVHVHEHESEEVQRDCNMTAPLPPRARTWLTTIPIASLVAMAVAAVEVTLHDSLKSESGRSERAWS